MLGGGVGAVGGGLDQQVVRGYTVKYSYTRTKNGHVFREFLYLNRSE